MRFSFQSVGIKGARLGFMTDVGRHGDRVFETPCCFLFTNKGCIPNLTNDTLGKLGAVYHPSMPLVLPLTGLTSLQESVTTYGKGIGNFIQLQEHLLYTSVQDPASEIPSGYNDKSGIALWSNRGKVQLDAAKFLAIQKAFKPDIYQALCDSDANEDSSKKRTRKSVDRSLELLDLCIKSHDEISELKSTAIFGTVQGGHDTELRIHSAKLTSKRPVSGFVLDGFSNYGPDSEKLCFDKIRSILLETLTHLPQDKTRLMHCIWRPDNVVEAVEIGIDLFDASYPHALTDRLCAFVLPLRNFLPANFLLEVSENTTKEPASNFELVLGEKRFENDLTPISSECICYTCRKFTRAYINHLITTSEMLAQVLLTIHNLHHYLLFFEAIRQSLKDDKFEKLKEHVLLCK